MRDSILDHPAGTPPELDTLRSDAVRYAIPEAVSILDGARAWQARERMDYAAAHALADAAVHAATQAGSSSERARALVTRAMVRLEQGDDTGTRADLAEAADTGNTDVRLLLASALVAVHSGDVVVAERLLRQARADGTADALTRMKVLNNLASVVRAGDPDEALDLLSEARDLVPPSHEYFVPFLEHNRGLALAQAGRLPAALSAFDASMATLHQSAAGLRAELHLEVADVLGRLRLIGEARRAAALGVRLLALDGAAMMHADALVTSARLAMADGDTEAARSLLADALALYTRQSRPAGSAITRLELLAMRGDAAHAEVATYARELTQLRLVREAARGWLHAAAAAETQHDLAAAQRYWITITKIRGVEEGSLREAYARASLVRGDVDAARTHVRAGLAVIDSRAALASAPDLAHRIAADRNVFEVLLRRCHRTDSPTTQLDSLLVCRPPASGDEQPSSPGEEEHRMQWRELARRVESAQEDPATLITLGARLALTEQALRTSAWARAGAGGGRTAYGLADLTAHVRCAILAVARIGDDAVAFHHAGTDAQDTRAVTLGPWGRVRDDLAQLTRGLSRVATGGAGSSAYAGTRALAEDLDAGFAEILPRGRREELLVLLDRGLDSAPLTALPSIWPRPVRFASLATTSASTDSVVLTRDPSLLVAVGPRLECAEEEAAQVAAGWGGGLPVRTSLAVRGALVDADIAHFAAHASLRWDNPLQSVIHLHDGPFALTELLATARRGAPGRPRMRLLYLSACSLASAPTDEVLIGAIPMLAERVADEVVACAIPLPDAQAPVVARVVHRAVRSGASAAHGLARARLDLGADIAETGARAALASLAAYVAVP